MNVGSAEVDITPKPGIDLSGFLARRNPSTSVLDPIFVKALYLDDRNEQLLWLHADLLGFDRRFVAQFRAWAANNIIAPDKVLLSATHTHSAPTPMILIGCGERDTAFVDQLFRAMMTAASEAKRRARPATLVSATSELDLAIDRRKKPTAHVDRRVTGVGWKDERDQFIAAVMNYTMHPVALGSRNRAISSDWCGHAAARASRELPGQPIVLMTNGAAGNINPPWENVSADQLRSWGEMIPASIVTQLANARAGNQTLKVTSIISQMPIELLSERQIDELVEHHTNQTTIPADWAGRYADAIRCWGRNRKAQLACGIYDWTQMETMAIRLGDLPFVTAGGEFFSRYSDLIQDESGKSVRIIGYANGNFGYVSTSAAYDEGGYEVDSAHFFYDTFRARRGAFEQLAHDAAQLVRQL